MSDSEENSKPRPSAVHDFDVIRARIEELRKERESLEKSDIGQCKMCQDTCSPCTGNCFAD